MNNLKYIILMAIGCHMGCTSEVTHEGPLFTRLSTEETGIDFSNDLTFDAKFNVYTYRNFYNGGGVSIGDINRDGLPDIYLTANLKPNKLFLNKGDLKFKDVTESAGVAGTRAWSTGVTMADVNGDGLLDIYVCNSGDIEGDNKQNELFINNGDLTFTESAAAYGLDDRGFSTHASFFDYDKDGDLDAYVLNNSYQSIASFNLRKNERPKRDVLGGDKMMRNDDGKFIDVSEQAGVYGSIIGFGLGVTVGDVNGDTWDDIYVSNDFFERDYLYINNQDGTFSEKLTEQMKSISGASMGADMADMNNDGLNDIFVTEMLPSDYERLKSVTTFEDWNRYQYSVTNDYYHQFTRNTFQVNNGDNTFHEVGRYAGIEATDWSWGALIFDMDNDGYKDLFVANGIYQDLTDQDYLNYISNEAVVESIVSSEGVDYEKLIEPIPSNPIPNHAFHNQGDLQFEDKAKTFGLDDVGFSNGSAYADLDLDGDLDLVVSNVNDQAWFYRNNAEKKANSNFVQFDLKGEGLNKLAIGTKIKVTSEDGIYYVEQQPIRGFQSSIEPKPHLGLKSDKKVDIDVSWPSGKVSKLNDMDVNQTIVLSESDGKMIDLDEEETTSPIFVKSDRTVTYLHEENAYVDFDRDRLIYHMSSTEGPRLSFGDIDQDGNEDMFISGAKDYAGKIFTGTKDGVFSGSSGLKFESKPIAEDSESVFFDVEGDGDLDLYVCSGGVEFSQSSSALFDQLYINDGSGNLSLSDQILPTSRSFVSSSTVSVADIDQDGDADLFVGERMKLSKYGLPASGYFLRNDAGILTEVTAEIGPELSNIGMIKDSEFVDLDQDGDDDLIVTGEFMGIHVFMNTDGQFASTGADLAKLKGWWNRIHSADIDGDGDQDFLVGNHGENSRFKASEELPIVLFLNDFDRNGSLDPILAKYHDDGEAYPYALRHNLTDQIKSLIKSYPNYESFKSESIQEIFDPETLNKAQEIPLNFLSSVLVMNMGNDVYEVIELPAVAQLTTIYAISSGDYDRDGDIDVLLGGNLYGTKPEVGRYDASYGTLLLNDGKGNLSPGSSDLGFFVDGEVRDIVTLNNHVYVARNSDSLVVFQY